MKRLLLSITALGILVQLIGCSPQAVSFQKSGDENATDIPSPEDPGPQPCTSNCGPTQNGTDVFFQTPRDGRVDVLIVDDNSGSMETEQSLLGDRLNNFIAGLQGLDWQIGITTTDVSSSTQTGLKGKLLNLDGRPSGEKILKNNTPNKNSVFKNTIMRPETIGCTVNNSCPSGNEQPLYASILAMDKRNSDNANFFRNGADLAIVMLTDEDEMSTGPNYATTPQAVIDKARSIWGQEKKLSVYGIIIEPGDQNCLQDQRAQSGGTGEYGDFIADLVNMTGGVTGSVCDSDYSTTLEEIGRSVRELFDSFELAHVPVASTVQVTLTPTQNITWRIQGNKLIFSRPPSAGTRVDVRYQYR